MCPFGLIQGTLLTVAGAMVSCGQYYSTSTADFADKTMHTGYCIPNSSPHVSSRGKSNSCLAAGQLGGTAGSPCVQAS